MSTATGTASIHLKLGLFGGALGASLSMIGFADYGELQNMFTFDDFRLLLAFCGAVGLSFGAFATLGRVRGNLPKYPIHRGTIVGGVLFGAGWAITGACPTIVFVQLGEGKVLAIATIVGIAIGFRLFGFMNGRWFQIAPSGCEV